MSASSSSGMSSTHTYDTDLTSIDDHDPAHDDDDEESREGSPAPSVYSVTSSIRAQSFRNLHGRRVNAYSELYRLPADDDELRRLDRQHVLIQSILGAQWPLTLTQVLAHDDTTGTPKAALDLGTGSGAWILDVARNFPNAHCVAVDLVPVQPPFDAVPPNCRFEVDDVNLGLEHFYGSFDVLHARLIASGIRDYAGLVEHVARVLRPGGLALFREWDFRIHDARRQPYLPSSSSCTTTPALGRWFGLFELAVRKRGGHADAAALLHRWTSQHRMFAQDIEHKEHWVPATPFDPRFPPRLRRLAEGVREDLRSFISSGRPLLLLSADHLGITEATLNDLERDARRELDDASIPMWMRLVEVNARKRR